MKHVLPLLMFLCTLGSLTAQQTIFVKHNATGAGTGSSWLDAFTTLDTALITAQPGDQIWVAAGTYKPNAATANASFLLQAGIALYGGFNGTETLLSARNPVINLCTLSGDLSGNDVVGNFAMNRTDNSTHVIEVVASAEPSDRAIVDGFTISGGNTKLGNTNPTFTRYGGGILAGAKLTARNCRFTDNNGEYGGGLAATTDAASGLLVDNCLFDKNTTGLICAGLYFNGLANGAAINRCIFRENTTIRGSMYMIGSANVVVDSCLFENNTAGTNPCAGMFTWQTTFTLTNSTFRNNVGVDYGAMYNDGRDGVFPFTIDNCLFEANKAIDTDAAASAFAGAVFNATTTGTIKNCLFKNNEADLGAGIVNSGAAPNSKIIIDSCRFEGNLTSGNGSRGGGIYTSNANYEVKNSIFSANTAGVSGSAIHNANITLYKVTDCTFLNGTAAFGGAVSNYNAGTGTYENCLFQNNNAATSGGAITNGFMAIATYKNCTIDQNTARFGGGIFAQNNDTQVTVQDCTITGNDGSSTGGGIFMSAGIKLLVENCLLELNTSDTGGGMAVSDDTMNLGNSVVRNTVFSNNFCVTQAAGLNISNTDVLLENCLFFANMNNGVGAGGAISNNASGRIAGGAAATSPLKAVNCTFADNVAVLGAGIAQWQDTVAIATTQLQNCILANNLLANYEIEDGLPTITSLGGNFSNDLTLALVLTATNDLQLPDPMFVDPSLFDYHLQAGSPCVDKGIAAGAPATDLEGNPRAGAAPDQGAYEYQTVGAHNPNVQVLPLRLLPNPAVERTLLVLENDWSGEVQVRVTGSNGALVNSFTANKAAGRWMQNIPLQNLPAGVYSVQVLAGTTLYEGSLVKK